MQDAENLAWKLDLVLKGQAGEALLDTYHSERAFGADENILNSSRATDFMTPKSEMSSIFRNAVLDLARDHSFARPLVNSGRLSVPCVYDDMPLFCADALAAPAVTRPGAACPDAPLGEGFLLDHLTGGFTVLSLGGDAPQSVAGLEMLHVAAPSEGLRARYMGDQATAVYLIRPDQHVVGRWPAFDADVVAAAHRRALGEE